MATKAETFRVKFKQKATTFGYTVKRTRPGYPNEDGTFHQASTISFSALDDPAREIKDREVKTFGLGDNKAEDGFKQILLPWDVDVVEGDKLTIVNVKWTYTVTKADNPFMIGSQVVYWQVQAVRDKKQ